MILVYKIRSQLFLFEKLCVAKNRSAMPLVFLQMHIANEVFHTLFFLPYLWEKKRFLYRFRYQFGNAMQASRQFIKR